MPVLLGGRVMRQTNGLSARGRVSGALTRVVAVLLTDATAVVEEEGVEDGVEEGAELEREAGVLSGIQLGVLFVLLTSCTEFYIVSECFGELQLGPSDRD